MKMSETVHTFKKSLAIGGAGESILDTYFKDIYDIEPVNMEYQKRGIDRIFTDKETGTVHTVEYKTDVREADTGNVFIEVWSNKQKKKRGWAYTSQAQWLYYYLPGSNQLCIIPMEELKKHVQYWYKTYKVARCVNRSGDSFYTSEGIIVPSKDFKKICHELLDLTMDYKGDTHAD